MSPDLNAELVNAEAQAWNALAHGKYAMFGYWGAWVVKLRALTGRSSEPSPFRDLIDLARKHRSGGIISRCDEPILAEPGAP